jgi:hypothetical protein
MAYRLEHKTNRQTSDGRYYPLGATLCEDGVNFAIYSQYASDFPNLQKASNGIESLTQVLRAEKTFLTSVKRYGSILPIITSPIQGAPLCLLENNASLIKLSIYYAQIFLWMRHR